MAQESWSSSRARQSGTSTGIAGQLQRARCVLLLLWLLAPFAMAASVQTFAPQGHVQGVQQVRATFTDDMVGLGDTQSAAPFDIDCPLGGNGHWVDVRTWVWDVPPVEANGQKCRFTVKPGLRTLAGSEIHADSPYGFTLDIPTNEVIDVHASDGQYGGKIKENQDFVLRFKRPIAQPLPELYCEDATGQRMATQRLPAPDPSLFAPRGEPGSIDPKSLLAVRCAQPLAAGTAIKLVMPRQGLKDWEQEFQVREPFRVHGINCGRLSTQGAIDCLPDRPISMYFSGVTVPDRWLGAIRLSGPHGLASGKPHQWTGGCDLEFSPPFDAAAQYKIIYPPGFVDADGRSLDLAKAPASVRIVAIPVAAFAVRPLAVMMPGPMAQMPILLSHGGHPVGIRELIVGLGADTAKADAELVRWSRGFGLDTSSPVDSYELPAWQGDVLHGEALATQLPLPALPPGPSPKINLPLHGHGLHLLEMQTRGPDDPIGPMFDRSAALLTNMAVQVKDVGDDLAVWVTKMDNGQPLAGADISIYHCGTGPLWSGRTDSQGIARPDHSIAQPTCSSSLVVIARHRDRSGVPDVSLSTSEFGDGRQSRWYRRCEFCADPPREIYRVDTVLDRQLFRPGQTVRMHHVMRRETVDGLGAPLTADLPGFAWIKQSGTDNQWYLPLTWSAAGDALSDFVIPPDARLGDYSIRLVMSQEAAASARACPPELSYRGCTPVYFTHGFTVAAYRLPQVTATLSAGITPILDDQAPPIELRLHYTNGGSVKGWPVQLGFGIESYSESSSPDSDYTFGSEPPQYSWGNNPNHIEPKDLGRRSVTLDEDGFARLLAPNLPKEKVPYSLRVEATYADPDGEMQTLTRRFTVWPAKVRIGIFAERPMAVGPSVKSLLKVLVTDTSGKRLAGRDVSMAVVSATSASPKDKPDDRRGVFCRGRTDELGRLQCFFAPAQPGAYDITASTVDDAGAEVSIATQVWMPDSPKPTQRVLLSADRAQYLPGETAHLTVDSPFQNATAWLVVEREGILASRVLALHGRKSRIDVPIGALWSPNVFVSISAIAPAGSSPSETRGAASLATGYLDLRVKSSEHALQVAVTTDRTAYLPRQRARVKVRVVMPGGQPPPAGSRFSFVAVDESLLNLRENETWQLLDSMLHERADHANSLSTLSLSSRVERAKQESDMVDVMLAMMACVNDRRSSGGDHRCRPMRTVQLETASPVLSGQAPDVSEAGVAGHSDLPALRNLSDALLLWLPHVALDQHGEAAIDLPLSDALSRFRLVAVADVGTNYFGTGSTDIDVRQDVQLVSGLPPVVRQGDRMAVAVTVRNTGTHTLKLKVDARADGVADMPAQNVELQPDTSQRVAWLIDIPRQAGNLSWQFGAAAANDSGIGDRLQVTQTVEPAAPITVQAATFEQVDGRLSIPIAHLTAALPGSTRVDVHLQSSLANGMDGVRRWLRAYPFSCLEQRASIALALHDDAAWQALVDSLPKYLDARGLATYFPWTADDKYAGSDVLTAYLLSAAKESGRDIPERQRDTMLLGLAIAERTATRSRWAPLDDGMARKLVDLAALARYGRATPQQVAEVRVDPGQWTTPMLIDWLTILRHVDGVPDVARLQADAEQQLRARLSFQGGRIVLSHEQQDAWWWMMQSGDSTAAQLLLAVGDLPSWHEDLPRMLRGLLARQTAGAWSTTTANLWGTLAVERISRKFESTAVTGKTEVVLGSDRRESTWPTDAAPVLSLKLPDQDEPLRVQHDGKGKPWITVQTLAALPLASPQFAGYRFQKSLTPVHQKTPGSYSVGDVWRVHLDVDAQADMTWVVVNDPIPAGASLLGSGLANDSVQATQGESGATGTWLAFQERDFTSIRNYYAFAPRGRFSMEYTIRLNQPGTFTLPATRVEAMYAPDVFGAAPNQPFEIKE